MLNRYKIYNYFSNSFELKESTNGWFRFEDAKAVNFECLVVKDFRKATKQSAISFISDIEFLSIEDTLEYINTFDELPIKISKNSVINDVNLPEYYIPITESIKASEYVQSRGFDLSKCAKLGFGYCYDGEFAGYLIIPLMKFGKLAYFIGRNILPNGLRYKNPHIPKKSIFFNEDALYLYEDIYIVEGWADAMSIGDNAIASLMLGLTLEQQSIIINSPVKSITFIPDKNSWHKWLKFAAKLSNDFEVYLYSLEDYENPDEKDVNAIGFERILKQKKYKYHINLFNLWT